MDKAAKQSLLQFLLFPGVAMLLGWGLRGYIGGGPFGAMIPGAMVALAIAMLLKMKPGYSSIIVVFGVIGVGLGGEMTYGQTLGFLRNPDTVWWGILATTIKGAVWGIGGGALIGLGFIYHRIPKKIYIVAFVLLLIGILIGFKLINDPKLIYFSDPVNKPRSESWGGLLFGAIAVIVYLKIKIEKADFSIIYNFAKWGLIGGALGFGLGGLWFVLGSLMTDILFTSWWKMMEFTFGLLLGMGLGYAAWKCRSKIDNTVEITDSHSSLSVWPELGITLLISLSVYLIIPGLLEPLAESMMDQPGLPGKIVGNVLRMFVNYAFYGFVMVLIVLYRNAFAWQIGITLTFCHTIIDYMRDLRPAPEVHVNDWIQLAVVAIATFIVAYLVAIYRRKRNINNSMMQILVWSTVTIAFLSLASDIFVEGKFQYTDIASIIVKTLFVHIIFLTSAIFVSRKSSKLMQADLLNS